MASLAALSLASFSILSILSSSRLLLLVYVWNVPLPAPAAEPWTFWTTVGTFWVM